MAFIKAERKRAKARVAIEGPSGSGKSMSALLLAKGLSNGGRVAAIDTENGSLSLYSDITEFDVCELLPPYSPERYIQVIQEAEKAGYETIIIDSLSHEWIGKGGILDIHSSLQGNSFANWKIVNPRHQALVDAMLTSPCHIIATLRSKTEYIQTEDSRGKAQIQKAGTAPQQRDGLDYEFTVVFDVRQTDHVANATKDRTSLFDGAPAKITAQTGEQLKAWLDGGIEAPPPAPRAEAPAPQPAQPQQTDGIQCPICGKQLTNGQAVMAQRKHDGLCVDCYSKRQRETESRGKPQIKEPDAPASQAQIGMLVKLFKEKQFGPLQEDRWLVSRFNVGSKKQLTKQQASDAIEELQNMTVEEARNSLPLDPGSPESPDDVVPGTDEVDDPFGNE